MMKSILVIEDNAVAADVYRSTLAREGYRVEVARDGQAGIEALDRARPDLVLLDLMLPKVNGVDVLRHIRATRGDIPVVITSNAITNERMEEIWAAGVTQVLSKANSSPKEVARLVKQLLAG